MTEFHSNASFGPVAACTYSFCSLYRVGLAIWSSALPEIPSDDAVSCSGNYSGAMCFWIFWREATVPLRKSSAIGWERISTTVK